LLVDLLDSSHWRPVWALLHDIDQQIAGLYAEAGLGDVRPRFVGPMIRLHRREPMTIQDLATHMEVTHSAMSQTVAAMRRAGRVEDASNIDGRTRRIQLTERSRSMMPFLVAEWRGTEAILRGLEDEIPYPLPAVVADIQRVFAGRSFQDRLRERISRELG
jgi:DNA-binding MarR family transcriptional regulator